ncbi:MAG: VanW family protein [Spirochaetes bacterium]|jgi:vancomycin resistance protein YoaR|nr:VanW family protein [Spirochaetota bacterium]
MPARLILALALVLNLRPDTPPADGRPAVIASFATSIEDQDEAVRHNIRLACAKLDGRVMPPKSVFSFNDTVGEGSVRNGYRNGAVLYRDEVRYEPGGGLCQVSSTLFNALLAAGCAIAERHRHFQPVTYVPPGLDATIKYGKKDLRMRNPYDQKLYIDAIADGKSLVIRVRAEAPPPFRYELVAEEEEADHPIEDDGRRLRGGISVSVYRKKYAGGTFIESLLLYRDYYPAVYLK